MTASSRAYRFYISILYSSIILPTYFQTNDARVIYHKKATKNASGQQREVVYSSENGPQLQNSKRTSLYTSSLVPSPRADTANIASQTISSFLASLFFFCIFHRHRSTFLDRTDGFCLPPRYSRAGRTISWPRSTMIVLPWCIVDGERNAWDAGLRSMNETAMNEAIWACVFFFYVRFSRDFVYFIFNSCSIFQDDV